MLSLIKGDGDGDGGGRTMEGGPGKKQACVIENSTAMKREKQNDCKRAGRGDKWWVAVARRAMFIMIG